MIESKHMHIIVGLGNPGEEYKTTRHNAGRIAVEYFAKKFDFPDFELSKKYQSFSSASEISEKIDKKNVSEKVLLLLPETFMNKSGKALESLYITPKKAEKLIVVHDDLDMPVGKIKIMFNRGSGGHKGVESIIRNIKTEAFVRIKIGVCPTTPSGKLKKPEGEKLLDFIVGNFKKEELDEIKKVSKYVAEALKAIVLEGREAAMNEWNQR